MGRKAGDNHCVPLNHQMHHALHAHGGETAFFNGYGIEDALEIAAKLYELTRDHQEAEQYLERKLGHLWVKFRLNVFKRG